MNSFLGGFKNAAVDLDISMEQYFAVDSCRHLYFEQSGRSTTPGPPATRTRSRTTMRTKQLFVKGICFFVIVFPLLLIYFNAEGQKCYHCVTPEHRQSRRNHIRKTEINHIALPSLNMTSEHAARITTEAYTSTGLVNKYSSKWWRNHTETVCRQLKMNTNSSLARSGAFAKILVDNRHKLLYCQMAKVASSNLGKIFAILVGFFNKTNPNLVPSSDVHNKYNTLHKHLGSSPTSEITYKLQHYYKFIFVRDPLERVVSAYRNKFIKPSTNYFSYLNTKIATIYRTNSSFRGGTTFEEFVRYLTDPERKVVINHHWQPFYQLCSPCEVKYDYVGKIATFNGDTRHILEVNNLTSLVDFPKMPDTYHSLQKTDILMNRYYSVIPKELLVKLYKIYFPDYAIFDLEVPSFIKEIITQVNAE